MYDEGRASTIYKAVGRKVAAKRHNILKVTQEKLSELTRGRLSRSAIANIESGRQRVAVHHLYELAVAMSCEPSDFLPPAQEILELSKDLVASVEGDPEASEFTRRILGLDKVSEITLDSDRRGRKK